VEERLDSLGDDGISQIQVRLSSLSIAPVPMLAPVLFPNADKLVIEAPDPVTASFPKVLRLPNDFLS
jgi:hypothetical protein